MHSSPSLSSLNPVTMEQPRRLGRALSLRIRQHEEEAAAHLTSSISLTFMKGLASLVLNRIPVRPSDETAGCQ